VIVTAHPCYLCGAGSTPVALCWTCRSDLEFLNQPEPDMESTEEEIRAWAKANKVTVFSCGKK